MNANPYACMVIGNRKQCLDLTAHFVLDNWAFISLRAFRDFRGKPPWVEIHFDSTTVQVIKRRCLQACPLLCLLTVNRPLYPVHSSHSAVSTELDGNVRWSTKHA